MVETGFLSSRGVLSVLIGAVLACTQVSPAGAQQVLPSGPPPTTPSGPEVIVPSGRTPAQDAARSAGRPVTNEQIAEAIRRSGLNRAQVRARLQQSGYDPNLAEPFFSGSVRGQTGATADSSLVGAMQDLGLLQSRDPEGGAEESLDGPSTAASRVFGKVVFSGSPRNFDPITAGPVDPSYRLGVGDVLQVVVTGDIEYNGTTDIRRDGTIIWPVVGQIPVAGLTMDAARSLIRQRAGRVYGQIESGRAQVDVSLTRIRSNLVYVIGEVERPSAYQLSALASVFNALVHAGGPTEGGSFRQIEVRRAGNVIHRVDLYNYLVRGDNSADIRTESGDIIFVPPVGRQIAVTGAVRRPGVYELREGESFRDLTQFAGGLLSTASRQRIQVDRVLPPHLREPGRDRVLFDVSLYGSPSEADTVPLIDQDLVQVFSVGNTRRNLVSIEGEVHEPGEYEWRAGMTLGDLVRLARGPLPWALTDRIKITRVRAESGTSEQFSADIRDSDQQRFPLMEFDQIEVLDGRKLVPTGFVTVEGAVSDPGRRAFVERQSLRDLIDLAGGFQEDAQHVEVSRRRFGESFSDTMAIVHQIPINGATFGRDGSAGRFLLERGDHVAVRRSPGFRSTASVQLSGLFEYPGSYTLRRDGETVRDAIGRAGLLPNASLPTFRLLRGGRVVPIDLARALKGDPTNNVVLVAGDELMISADPQTVLVTGAVERPMVVPARKGWRMSDYIEVAGGRKPTAAKTGVLIEDASGGIRRASRRWRFFGEDPVVTSGSTVTVLEGAESSRGNSETLTRVVQVTTTAMSLIIGYLAATK
jgi:polysaccharide biosynthesis/export protein